MFTLYTALRPFKAYDDVKPSRWSPKDGQHDELLTDIVQLQALESWKLLNPAPCRLLLGNNWFSSVIAKAQKWGHLRDIAITDHERGPLVTDAVRAVADTAIEDTFAYAMHRVILPPEFVPTVNALERLIDGPFIAVGRAAAFIMHFPFELRGQHWFRDMLAASKQAQVLPYVVYNRSAIEFLLDVSDSAHVHDENWIESALRNLLIKQRCKEITDDLLLIDLSSAFRVICLYKAWAEPNQDQEHIHNLMALLLSLPFEVYPDHANSGFCVALR